MPKTFLLVLLLPEFPELLLFLLELVALDELGTDVEFPLDTLLLFALLLFFVLLLLPLEFEDPADPPDDCFSFLSLIIIYTVADHLHISFGTLTK